MKNLQTIQKTFKIFGILSKVAMILSFVGAGAAAVGPLIGIVMYNGGNVYNIFGEKIIRFTKTSELTEMIGVMLADFILALSDGILFLLAMRYFNAEQADGTPFTVNGAERIKRLGIQSLVIPPVAFILSSIVYQIFNITKRSEWGNGATFIIGIVLILVSMIFHYGAELEKNNKGESDEK